MRVHRFRLFAALTSAAVIVFVFAGSAFGTPPSGIVSGPILARGDFVDDVDVKIKLERDGNTVVSNAPSAGEVVVQEITIAPGGTTGWHSHPGPVVVVVKAGTLTYVRPAGGECIATPYAAGTAFVDSGQGHAHTAFNLGAENLVLIATYFDVPAGGSARIDVPVVPPAC
jgi:oxalate decarboxylase/phosphoglucose isomerase-like protein (cupin superfamily)